MFGIDLCSFGSVVLVVLCRIELLQVLILPGLLGFFGVCITFEKPRFGIAARTDSLSNCAGDGYL